jgi:hypothetical protein
VNGLKMVSIIIKKWLRRHFNLRELSKQLKTEVMSKSNEGKEHRNHKKEPAKSLKEKRASKAAKRDEKNSSGTILQN